MDAKSRQRTQTLSKHSTQPWPSEGKRCNKVLPRKSFPESVSRKWRVEMAGQTSGKIGASACQRGGPQGVALMQFHTRSRIISASCADHRCRPQGGIQVGIQVCFCACDCGVALAIDDGARPHYFGGWIKSALNCQTRCRRLPLTQNAHDGQLEPGQPHRTIRQ